MQLSQLQAAIQAHGYGSDTASQQLVFLNTIYRKVCGMQRWPFLEANDTSMTTTVGVNVYTPTMTNWRNFDALRLIDSLGNGINLEYKQPQDLRDLEHDDSITLPYLSQPLYWTMITQKIHLWPVPDDVYTLDIDYIIQPPDLVNPADVPVLPVDYHDVLVFGACKGMALRERDLWSVGNFGAEYEERLGQMRSEYFVRQRQTSSRVAHSKDKWGRFGQVTWYPGGW